MLFRMNTLRCVVVDIPMDAVYGSEKSNLRISRIVGEFALKHARNTISRIFYNYFLRDFSIASLELVVGVALIAFGGIFGARTWLAAAQSGNATPLGTIMLAVLPMLLGVQLLLAFIAYDMASTPTRAAWPRTARSTGLLQSQGRNGVRTQEPKR
jgi:Na+/serine symporter